MPEYATFESRCIEPMSIAIVGCGYVADFYMATLAEHPALRLIGVYDNEPDRLAAFSKFHGAKAYESFQEVLDDPSVEMVLNLTNPRSHFEVSKATVEAGKHVYSEKPLAMDATKATKLVELAKECGLAIATAPCSMLSETAQTMWKALKDDLVGPVRLVYAAFDDGMIHHMNPTRWTSASGAHWPAKDEYEIGCTYEHAAYVLSWLAAFFGPAKRILSYASVQVKDKGVAVDKMAPDFSVGCIEYADGVVARITCSLMAPIDKSITIIGERGTLSTNFVRNDASPVYLSRTPSNRYLNAIGARLRALQSSIEHILHIPWSLEWQFERKVPYARKPSFLSSGGNKPVDFLRGPAELAAAIRESRPCRLSPELGVHMTELIETLQHPERFERPHTIKSTFEPIEPLIWRA